MSSKPGEAHITKNNETVWQTREPLNYTNWQENEPNHSGPLFEIHIQDNQSLGWNDVPIDRELKFIVEIESFNVISQNTPTITPSPSPTPTPTPPNMNLLMFVYKFMYSRVY